MLNQNNNISQAFSYSHSFLTNQVYTNIVAFYRYRSKCFDKKRNLLQTNQLHTDEIKQKSTKYVSYMQRRDQNKNRDDELGKTNKLITSD